MTNLPALDVHRDATDQEKIAARQFRAECDKLLLGRNGLLAVVEKLRLEQLIRERQLIAAKSDASHEVPTTQKGE
jgi:hypothetical protein